MHSSEANKGIFSFPVYEHIATIYIERVASKETAHITSSVSWLRISKYVYISFYRTSTSHSGPKWYLSNCIALCKSVLDVRLYRQCSSMPSTSGNEGKRRQILFRRRHYISQLSRRLSVTSTGYLQINYVHGGWKLEWQLSQMPK